MKPSILILMAILLATSILAPSVITLTTIEDKAIAIDFNEEEKKEEKKEVEEKDFFIDAYFDGLTQIEREKKSIPQVQIEVDYSSSLAVFLPPPKQLI